jgi:hypothetical protein
MSLIKGLVVGLFLLALSVIQIPAQLLFTDGFESYVGGAAPLDKNYAAGANAAPNGSGNPWFGPAPPNARVVASGDGGVTAHSGNQMIRSSAPSDLDENWYNLAYRQNGGNPYTGNIQYSWWFYDPLGSGGSNFRDYAALGYYNTAPGNTDYPGTGSLNGSTQIQRLSLGASSPAGFDATTYQARVVGATDGLNGGGWFNLSVTRSVGWHEGKIVVDGANNVSFYIDDMINPLFTHSAVETYGYNVLELNTGYGPTTGYFDDVSFSVIPEPNTAALLLCGGLTWLALRRRK